MRTGKKALLDIGLYVLVSLFVVGVIFAAVEFDVPKYLFLRWFGIAGFTLILFAQFIGKSRDLWQRRSFWTMVSIFVVAHLGILIAIVISKANPSTFQLMIIFFAEAVLFAMLRRTVFRRTL
jgi:MFS-type transporter involved in bile tolerance (Atg22 family)